MERWSIPAIARPERAILFTIEAWDVNCSQHITERFTEGEIAGAVADCASGSRAWRRKTRGSAPNEKSLTRNNRQAADRPSKRTQPLQERFAISVVLGQYYCPNW